MRLVVDTNIVFSLFKRGSFTNQILRENHLELFAPEELIDELEKYADDICNKSEISKGSFLKDIALIPELIELKNASIHFENQAKAIISHESDFPFLALALELKIPIWSNDIHLKQQSQIKVFNTQQLRDFLSKNS